MCYRLDQECYTGGLLERTARAYIEEVANEGVAGHKLLGMNLLPTQLTNMFLFRALVARLNVFHLGPMAEHVEYSLAQWVITCQ